MTRWAQPTLRLRRLPVRAVRRLQAVDSIRVNRIVFERDRVVVLETLAQKTFDVGVVRGLHDEFMAVPERADLSLFDCQFAPDRKSTRLNSSHLGISYAVFCLKNTSTKI